MKILIVDDSAPVRAMLRTILSTPGDIFHECLDGSEALTTYETFQPDWVLMDIKMKRMDGIQATAEILSEFPDAKIIIVTQYDDLTLTEKAKCTGARALVLKENLLDVKKIIRPHCN